MMKMNLFERAVEHFGRKAQIVKAIEELSELIVELAKEVNGTGDHKATIEEIADVNIMISQLMCIYPVSKIYDLQNYKLERLQSLIDADDAVRRMS